MASRKSVVLAALLAISVIVVGCSRNRTAKSGPAPAPKPVSAGARASLEIKTPGFASTKSYDALAAEDKTVVPAVPAYTVKPDLSNVANLKLFKPVLEPELKKALAKNQFAVTPTDYVQMFHVYENNEYQRPKFGAFITTDSMLHTYHVFYDYSLRSIESHKLFDAAVKLTDGMLALARKDLASVGGNAQVKDAARRNVAYFAVARNLLKGTPVPAEVRDIAGPDLKLIAAHQGRDMSSVLGVKVDFSQFIPRGHYTRSEKLKKYFKGLMWYGLVPFPVPDKKTGPTATIQALLIVRHLGSDKDLLKLWDTIYEPTVFYVGKTDDYTVYQYSALMDKVFGKDAAPAAFADKSKLNQFVAEVNKLPGPGIENYVADASLPTGRQFRFMGQRFIPDSRILQELTTPKASGRNFPKGLDVFAAMGSDRALDILHKTYNVSEFGGFDKQMRKMRKEMADTTEDTWKSNLYYGWMWSLQSLVKPAPEGYPSFMRSNAWIDKSLFTGLGSWTELRHDTILYAKQSVSECGGDGEEPKTPKGYVEPNLEFWTKLAWLNKYTMQGLKSRGLLNPELKDKFESLDEWLTFCRKITIKELTGKKVTEDEYLQMCSYGSSLERITLSLADGAILSDTDKDMALVADVHTSQGDVLEEGTGRAGAIYVIVPIQGKLYLTRGAVYTQYEFEHPAADRLTDEKWQKMLKTNMEPGFAEWVKSFFIKTKKKPAPEFANFPEGC